MLALFVYVIDEVLILFNYSSTESNKDVVRPHSLFFQICYAHSKSRKCIALGI